MNERGITIEQKKPVVKRVLYGAWDAGKKALESQSPEAWGNRIIRVIDDKIIPKLSPNNQQWAEDHQEAIRDAAMYAGVGITTAEIVLATVVVDRGIRKLFPPRDLYPELTQWAHEAGELFTIQHGVGAAAAGLFATTLRSMAIQALSDTPQLESTMHIALSKRKHTAFDRVRHTFARSYIDTAHQMRHPISRLDEKAQQAAAEQAFRQWNEGMQLRGLEEIFQLSQKRPHVDPQLAIKAAVRLSGHRMPITLDEKATAALYFQQYQSPLLEQHDTITDEVREHEHKMSTTMKRLDRDQKLHAERVLKQKNMSIHKLIRTMVVQSRITNGWPQMKRNSIERKIRRLIKRKQFQNKQTISDAQQWKPEPKPTIHRFLDADGNIIRPSKTPPVQPLSFEEEVRRAVLAKEETKKQAKEKKINTPQVMQAQRQRMIQDREAVQRELGTFDHRLQRALQRAYSPTETPNTLLVSLLHHAHNRAFDRDEIGILLIRIDHVGKFDHGDGVTLKDRKTIATKLFQKLFGELPPQEQKRIPRKQRESLFSQLAERWTDQMNCAGLDVVLDHDVRDRLNQIGKGD